ncbi:MAG: heavy-metal-associated domain-containing protein [Candidatus Adiutrix sp.]|jgi:copper chaperone|nr:heavy-metal-associated domain-containing protein [Candidatus Adiutrix sp.]
MEPVELKIEGLSCQHCVSSVKNALSHLAGVSKVEVSLENKSARVWGEADKGALIAAVAKAGFSAS